MANIFNFLELDYNVNLDFSKRYQVAGKPKIKIINDLLVKPNFLKNRFRKYLPQKIENYLLLRDKN